MISIANLSTALGQSVRVTRHWVALGILKPSYGEKHATGRLVRFTLEETRWAFLVREMAQRGYDLERIAKLMEMLRGQEGLVNDALDMRKSTMIFISFAYVWDTGLRLICEEAEREAPPNFTIVSLPTQHEEEVETLKLGSEAASAFFNLIRSLQSNIASLHLNVSEIFRNALWAYNSLKEAD